MKKSEVIAKKIKEMEKPVFYNYNYNFDVMEKEDYKKELMGKAYIIMTEYNIDELNIKNMEDKKAISIIQDRIDKFIQTYKEYNL